MKTCSFFYRSHLNRIKCLKLILSLMLELALLFGPAQIILAGTQIDIPGPASSGVFGKVTALPDGNFLVIDSGYDAPGPVTDVGAVYYYNGKTGSLISTLTGSTAGDQVGDGGVMVLGNGSFLIKSLSWHNGSAERAGAVTWVNQSAPLNGVVSAANSLVGSTKNDTVGWDVIELSNSNFVVRSISWNNGSATGAGAVTWGNGNTGVSGVVSAANSLVGSSAGDEIGMNGVVLLKNGSYLVISSLWDNGSAVDAGAVTWGSGSTGVKGVISSANSLVGSTSGDGVGTHNVTVLSNGNYVISSPDWDNGTVVDAGAVTFGTGAIGVSGAISAANSLVGSSPDDQVGFTEPLDNGNYVVWSPVWDDGLIPDVGAVTWVNGATGLTGVVSAANSLIGSTAGDHVGYVAPLTHDNYLVISPDWDHGTIADVGAVTWVNGAAGMVGIVSAANSLVGSTAGDQVGSHYAARLSNGNYVVCSPAWDNGAISDVGAVTWGSGTTGLTGVVSPANSLIGSSAGDQVGFMMILSNGNYVVNSPYWDNGSIPDVGAVTWVNGGVSTSGVVSTTNSLVGSSAGDQVGLGGSALLNGSFVVTSNDWANGSALKAGAVTWVSGSTGLIGAVSAANSLVGSTAGDQVGSAGITSLSNGNYVILSPHWHNGSVVDAGAVTWGNGMVGANGIISAANSLVGSTTNDVVGCDYIYFNDIPYLECIIPPLSNGNYLVSSPEWDNHSATNAGAVTWVNGAAGIQGEVSVLNSLVGSTTNDRLGLWGITALSDGNFVVKSPFWDNQSAVDAGAVTWGSYTGVRGIISASNSVLGRTASGGLALNFAYDPIHHQLVVGRPADNILSLFATVPGPYRYYVPLSTK
jgi:hypothetical protein